MGVIVLGLCFSLIKCTVWCVAKFAFILLKTFGLLLDDLILSQNCFSVLHVSGTL